MNLANAFRILASRWRIMLFCTIIAVAAAAGYSVMQTARYQATATVLVHPSSDANSPSIFSDELNLLSYGSLTQTFASLARSADMIKGAAARVGVRPDQAARYSATAALIPQTTVLEISVDGPDRGVVVRLANQLVSDVSAETKTYFHIIDLTPLDPANGPALQTAPRTARNIGFGGAAGLILGALIASVIPVSTERKHAAGRSDAATPAGLVFHWLGDQLPTDGELSSATEPAGGALVETATR
jgi:succinoglycan biosynthesis transport protein ExoP